MTDQAIAPCDLAALTASRICHDLTSPIGAVGNGLELLEQGDNSIPDDNMALISQSVTLAKARLRFLRLAFGAAQRGQVVAHREITDTLADMVLASRINVDWQVADDCTRGEVKLAFLLLQCLESAMPFGGTVTVSHGAGRGWRLDATATRLRDLSLEWEALARQAAPDRVTAPMLHFALAPVAARALERRIAVALEERRIILSF